MKPERLKKLREIISQITDLPSSEWPLRLDAACEGDPSLYQDAISLLRDENQSTEEMRSKLAVFATEEGLKGTCLGVWRLEQPLGKGGMGSVWLAGRNDGAFDMKAALKLIHRHGNHPKFIKRFQRERQILADLRHPYIAGLLDGGEKDGRPFLVMEYIEGAVIDRYCELNELSIPDRVRLIQKIGTALGYAHGMGVIHRDIKPANLMVMNSGEPKLLDFGIAGLESENADITRTGVSPMTPAYASPEQLRGSRVTEQSDIYSLGLVLLELVTGLRPVDFQGDPTSVFQDPKLQVLPEDLIAVLKRSLAPNHESRQPSAAVFAAELEQILAGEPVGLQERVVPGVTGDSVIKTLLILSRVDSAHLLQALGDAKAAQIIADQNDLARSLIQAHQGREVYQADGFFVLFDRPIQALAFALSFHGELDALHPEPKPAVCIGIHLGEVVLRESRLDFDGGQPLHVEGLAKVLASGLASLAGARQTLLSWAAFEMARRAAIGDPRFETVTWLEHGDYHLKDLNQSLAVFEVGQYGFAPLSVPAESEDAYPVKASHEKNSDHAFDADNPIGGFIGPYRIKEELGRLGRETTYLAVRENDGLELTVVVKLINGLVSVEEQQRFRHNRRLLAGLKHPHIALLMDGGSIAGRPYFIREHIEGRRIDQWSATQATPLMDLVRIFLKITSAVNHAHRKGVIHAGIKPGNLLVTQTVEPKLLDFSLTGQSLFEKESEAASFSREYESPQQKQGRPAHQSDDIFALGLLFLQILTGRRPSEWDHPPIQILGGLMAQGRPMPNAPAKGNEDSKGMRDAPLMDVFHERVPEALGYILRTALAVDPHKRYPDMAAFFADLERLLASLLLTTDKALTLTSPTYDLLLWHHPDDREDVRVLAEYLNQREDLRVWFEAWHVPLGASVEETIRSELDNTSEVLVCLGPENRRPWQACPELRDAFGVRSDNPRLQLLPVLLPGAAYPAKQSELPAFLRHRTWITFPHGFEGVSLQLLAQAVKGEAPDREDRGQTASCPFRGLEVFREADQHLFFGREAVTQRLVEQMTKQNFGAVLGASGSGKSSVVQAGLIPRMRKHNYEVILFKPGSQPLEELAFALHAAYQRGAMGSWESHTEQIQERLQHAPESLHFIGRELVEGLQKERLLLVINQFEELFTLVEDPHSRDALIKAICHVVDQPTGVISVVITMRSDFIGQCAPWPHLNAFISDHFIQVGPMNREQLRRAIEAPARLTNLQLERGLLEQILDDVPDEAGGLPLMQHALLELYQLRRGALLTIEAYDRVGGIQGALVRRAESEYEALDSDARKALRQMFVLCLIHPGEGSADTRRRATRQELLDVAAQPLLVETLLDRWIEARLLTGAHDPVLDQDVVDVAHEALIQKWARIDVWMQEGKTTAILLQRLRRHAVAWRELDCHEDHLLRGVPLQQMEALYLQTEIHLGRDERAFIEAGIAARDSAELEREASRSAELAAARKRVRRTLLVSGAFVLVVGLGAAFSLNARNQARFRRAQADELIGFMLGDLRKKLNSVGRLDVLADVGGRVRAYLGTLPEQEIEGPALAKQVALLHLIGEIALKQNDKPEARKSFDQSLIKAKVLATRKPYDRDRQMLLLVSHYWVATLAFNDDDYDTATVHHGACLKVAEAMTRRFPEDETWAKEFSYAHNNLGAVYQRQGKWGKALQEFKTSISLKEVILKRNPKDSGLKQDLADSLSWLGGVLRMRADFDQAELLFSKALSLQQALVETERGSVAAKKSLQYSFIQLAWVHMVRGESESALDLYLRALEINRELVDFDPENSKWKRNLAENCLSLAEAYGSDGDWKKAKGFLQEASLIVKAVTAEEQTARWRLSGARTHFLTAWVMDETGAVQQALESAQDAVDQFEALAGRKNSHNFVQCLNRLGKIHHDLGDTQRAKRAWRRALELAHPRDERDYAMISERAKACLYLDRRNEATVLLQNLENLGYRNRRFWFEAGRITKLFEMQ